MQAEWIECGNVWMADEAARLYDEAAHHGHALGAANLGLCWARGEGKPKYYKNAAAHVEAAADTLGKQFFDALPTARLDEQYMHRLFERHGFKMSEEVFIANMERLLKAPRPALQRLFSAIDADGSGTVDADEFMDAMKSGVLANATK